MQQAIDVVKDIFFGDFGAVIRPAALQNEVSDTVVTGILSGVLAVKKRGLTYRFLFIVI